MREDLFHFVWQYQLFSQGPLYLTNGKQLTIIQTGQWNHHAGPDFLNAKVEMDGLLWSGPVEIHTKASDWHKHAHSEDERYQNVILHVVYEADSTVLNRFNEPLPTLELKNRIQAELIQRYKDLVGRNASIPCLSLLNERHQLTIRSTMERKLIERLEHKSQAILQLLEHYQNDWQQTAYAWLAKAFGGSKNGDSFLRMAQRLPLKYIQKHRDSQMQIEALLFGMAGLLDQERRDDDYYQLLQRESRFLLLKYELKDKSLSATEWQTGRVRPQNHPVLRMAQLAALLKAYPDVFGLAVRTETPKTLLKNLEKVLPGEYWEKHYTFEKTTPKRKKKPMGKSFIRLLAINSVAPLLAAYGTYHDDSTYIDRAVELLEHLPKERNRITKAYPAELFEQKSAADSQALIQLFKLYCTPKNCLQCGIGAKLVKPGKRERS